LVYISARIVDLMNLTKSNKRRKFWAYWWGPIGLKYAPPKRGEGKFPITCEKNCLLWLAKAFS
jgi:hypothetical protein